MKAYLISDNVDTQVGMRLAGIKGIVVHEKESLLDEIQKASEDKDVGIIIVTQKVADMARSDFDRLKLEMDIPLIVEIPDRHGAMPEEDRITRYIKEAIGIKI